MTFRIALTQPAASADARRNGEAVRRLMRAAAGMQARLVHFPEGFLSGYAKEQIADWAEVDWAAARDELARIADLAAELGVWVVLGSAHPLTAPHRPHNSLYVISDGGRVVGRYDKRICSHTEITGFYSPGFEPLVFDVDGFRFGCVICVEVNFPELFAEYEELGVDCLLLSAYPIDSIFYLKARAHAAINNYWLSLSVPAQTANLMASSLIGPDGTTLASTSTSSAASAVEAGASASASAEARAGAGGGGGAELVVATLDRDAPELHVALNLARLWRASAREGEIYRSRRVDGDPRSADRTCV